MLFNPVTIIKKKRDGSTLTNEEITQFIQKYTEGTIPDYQMSALLMSIYFQSMNTLETRALTQAMLHSGSELNLEKIHKIKIDKHSTGGVGDKTSIILAPLLACHNIAVPMIAGRGLGHTGGTADKLESIPGFQTRISQQRFTELVGSIGCAVGAQSNEIAPADKKIYALRDVTATVDCIPLIVASIMSKKLAEDFNGLVLDVKTGNGAFMRELSQARLLAKSLASVAKEAGKLVRVLITDMSQPLGFTAGNSIEINECTAFLRRGPKDKIVNSRLELVTLELAAEMFVMAKKAEKKIISLPQAKNILRLSLSNGEAYSKFLEMVSLQGGDTAVVDAGLPLAPVEKVWTAKKNCFVGPMNTEMIGMALVEMGAGRKKANDVIDPSTGFYFYKHWGDPIKSGESIVKVYAQSEIQASNAIKQLQEAIRLVQKKTIAPKLIRERI